MLLARFAVGKKKSSGGGVIGGGSNYALFAGGINSLSAYMSSSEQIDYTTKAKTPGTSLSTTRAAGAATGSAASAYISGGGNGNTPVLITDKINFSSGALSSGGTLAGNSGSTYCAAGNATLGVHARTGESGAQTARLNYSDDSSVIGSSLTPSRTSMGAAGNSVQGLFAGGYKQYSPFYANDTCRYTYANHTVVTGPVLARPRNTNASASNQNTCAVFGGTDYYFGSVNLNTVDLYSHTNNTMAGGTTLSQVFTQGMATATPAIALVAGGDGAGRTAVIEQYTFGSNARVVAGNLTIATAQGQGVSSVPGGF